MGARSNVLLDLFPCLLVHLGQVSPDFPQSTAATFTQGYILILATSVSSTLSMPTSAAKNTKIAYMHEVS